MCSAKRGRFENVRYRGDSLIIIDLKSIAGESGIFFGAAEKVSGIFPHLDCHNLQPAPAPEILLDTCQVVNCKIIEITDDKMRYERPGEC